MHLRSSTTHIARPIASDDARPRLRGRWLLLAHTIWVVVAAISLGLFIVSVPVSFAARQGICAANTCAGGRLNLEGVQALQALGFSIGAYAAYVTLLDIVFVLGYTAVGAVIFWRKSDELMALFVALTLVLFGATWPLVPDLLAQAHPALRSLASTWEPLGFAAFVMLVYLFPDGRFVPRWVRWPALTGVLVEVLAIFFPDSPFNTDTWPTLLRVPLELIVFGLLVFTQIYRYVHVSGPVQRQQTKWVVFGLTLTIVGGALYALLGALFPALDQPGLAHLLFDLLGRTIFGTFTLLLIPLAIGIAILRYRLWDIDLIINRTLVYSALSTSVAGIYVLVVGGLGALFQARGELAISLIATALVALLFQPLRDRLQRGVNRLIYGERDDPYAVISRLGRRLESTLAPDAVLPTIVQTVQETLKLPYVAIPLDQDGVCTAAASVGTPATGTLNIPLVYQNEIVGQLILGPRTADEAFGLADRRLLDDLARQAGVAAHAVRLTADLQRSRERLVTAREEERRRLRRDLHDGLGPALATQTLKLEAARDLISNDPTHAEALLSDLIAQSQTSIADIRRLVYALRPPALDELGLAGAIREQAAQYGQTNTRIAVDAPEQLPPLPAAVEVAAYRIAQEALTNVVRHAQAHTCTIRLALDDALCLEISDDGRGLPEERQMGVGLNSMRERAAELGGTCVIEAASGGGARVYARLPLP